MKYLCSVVLFSFLISDAAAQQRLVIDSGNIQSRSFSAESIRGYKSDNAFQYEKGLGGPKSDFRRFWDWLFEKLHFWFGMEGRGLSYFLLVAIVVILVICILNLRGLNRAGLLVRRNKDAGVSYGVGEENIHDINFDKEIEREVHAKNFRMAVRLLYLQALKSLSEKGFIKWQVNKTNAAYLNELNSGPYHQLFIDLTIQFENNWYGAVPIDEKEFVSVSNRFQFFKKDLARA
jgi:hypothetical protein